jgi:anti-sigma factor RsiW
MNCQEFWDSMPELGAPADAAATHLQNCTACAARLNRQQELAAGLRTVAASYRGVGAPSRVESRLRSAFRAGVPAASLRPVWRPSFAWAAACAATFAIAFMLLRGAHPVAPQPIAAKATDVGLVSTADETPSDYEGFIPLPNAARLGDTEGVNLVRVEVPRSAMIALGFEVSPERATELVAADVMLGPDGLARAVRFLDSEGL